MDTNKEERDSLIAEIKEYHPKIANRIDLLWGSYELQAYLNALLITDRTNREGFSPNVFKALVSVSMMHQTQESTDTWSQAGFRS